MAVEPTKYQKEIKRLIFDVDWSTNPTVLKVKIHKDTVWLGEKLRFFGKSMTNKYCHFKNL